MRFTYKTLVRKYLREMTFGRSVHRYEYKIKNSYVDLQRKGVDCI